MRVRGECIDAMSGRLTGSGGKKAMHILKIPYCIGIQSTIMLCTAYHCALVYVYGLNFPRWPALQLWISEDLLKTGNDWAASPFPFWPSEPPCPVWSPDNPAPVYLLSQHRDWNSAHPLSLFTQSREDFPELLGKNVQKKNNNKKNSSYIHGVTSYSTRIKPLTTWSQQRIKTRSL